MKKITVSLTEKPLEEVCERIAMYPENFGYFGLFEILRDRAWSACIHAAGLHIGVEAEELYQDNPIPMSIEDTNIATAVLDGAMFRFTPFKTVLLKFLCSLYGIPVSLDETDEMILSVIGSDLIRDMRKHEDPGEDTRTRRIGCYGNEIVVWDTSHYMGSSEMSCHDRWDLWKDYYRRNGWIRSMNRPVLMRTGQVWDKKFLLCCPDIEWWFGAHSSKEEGWRKGKWWLFDNVKHRASKYGIECDDSHRILWSDYLRVLPSSQYRDEYSYDNRFSAVHEISTSGISIQEMKPMCSLIINNM